VGRFGKPAHGTRRADPPRTGRLRRPLVTEHFRAVTGRALRLLLEQDCVNENTSPGSREVR
jgi:hypothetical protein